MQDAENIESTENTDSGEHTLRRVRGLAVGLAGLTAVLIAIRWGATGYEWTLVGSGRPATSLTGMADGLELVRQVLYLRIWYTLASLLIGLPVVVVSCVWVARAHANATRRAPGSQRIPRGWAVTATAFAPVGVVLLPRVHTDLWRAAGGSRRAVLGVWLWWAAWVASTVVYFVALQIPPADVDDVAAAFSPMLWGDTAISVLATVWLGGFAWSVLGVSARQEAWRRAGVSA